jgi:hypothetical protein
VVVACLSDSNVVADKAAHCSQREGISGWWSVVEAVWRRAELGGSCECPVLYCTVLCCTEQCSANWPVVRVWLTGRWESVTRRFLCAGRGVREGRGGTAVSSELRLCRVSGEHC